MSAPRGARSRTSRTLCRGVLYFSALTRYDLKYNADRRAPTRTCTCAAREWYRRRLRRHFREAGLGFWLRRGAPLTLWELETA